MKIKLEAENINYEAIQHCNSRTDYKLIVHAFDPEHCDECNIVLRDIIEYRAFKLLTE